MPQSWRNKTFSFDDATWTDISVPFDCDQIEYTADVDFWVRTDKDDATTQREFIAGVEKAINSPKLSKNFPGSSGQAGRFRFVTSEVAFSVKAVTPATVGVLSCTFVR